MWMVPPMVGGTWCNPLDYDVGTAYYHSEYFWSCRIALQVRVSCDRIVEACCSIDDDTSAAPGDKLAEIVVRHLTGRPLSEALDLQDPTFWHLSLPKEAIYDALRSWARSQPDREAKLPPTPYEPRRAPPQGIIRRLLRSVGI